MHRHRIGGRLTQIADWRYSRGTCVVAANPRGHEPPVRAWLIGEHTASASCSARALLDAVGRSLHIGALREADSSVGALARPMPAVERFDPRLVVQDSTTAGYRDLLLTATATRDDGQAPTRKRCHLLLRYDGRSYPGHSIMGRFERWLGH